MSELQTVTIVGKKQQINHPEKPISGTSSDAFNLVKLEVVTNQNKSIDIKSLMLEMSYFEDIFRSATTGHILINDSIGFINNLKMNGSEKINLKFNKTTASDNAYAIEKTFRIVRIGERIRKNFNTETYSIHFCSEELLYSEQKKVSKSYAGKTISYIVSDILKSYLNVGIERQDIEETDGIYDFVIPYKKPFEAINFVMNYARSKTNNTAYDFVFFEDKFGFNFRSLQSLYLKDVYNSYSFSPKSYQPTSSTEELSRSINSIRAFTFLDTFDSLYGTTMGVFANRVITVDPLSRSYYVTDYDYDRQYKLSTHLNEFPLQKSSTVSYDSVLKVLTTNKNQDKLLGISDKPGAVSKDTYNEDRIRFRTAQMAAALYTRVKLNIAGDPNISVGDIIQVQLPLISESQTPGVDKYHSGKYIVTAVRQIVDSNMEYETILEIAKDSFSVPVSDIDVPQKSLQAY